MVSKTRDKFIEVARQLFARKGVENTTMNDIASASEKGRRTIYTYFKSKRKLREYIGCRFETMKEIVRRNGSLRAGFFRDVRKVDRARSIISKKEIAMLRYILEEGIKEGRFEIEDPYRCAVILTQAIGGLDVPYIRDNLSDFGIDKTMLKDYMTNVILNGIIKR